MARKKKQKQIVETLSNGFISYKGTVRIELMRGNKTYQTIQVSNQGMEPLFTFLAECLIGNFNLNLMPFGIRTFYTPDVDLDDLSKLFVTENTTTIIPKNKVTLDKDTGSSQSATAIYTYIIPFSSIVSSSTSNVIALYNRDNATVDSKNNPSAFIRLATKNESGWYTNNPIVADGISNIKVIWSMTINNTSN